MRFHNRTDAGRRLAVELEHLRGRDIVVLGLPRGGVPVAFEVARALGAPLDVIVVGKVGVPWQPELAMGAVGEGGASIVDAAIVRATRVDPRELATATDHARVELDRRVKALRRGRAGIRLDGRTAVIVDDGIATGSTARAACQVARAHGAARVVLAAPVAPADTLPGLLDAADEVVCLAEPERFQAVGQWYDDFTPTSDAEVVALLDRAAATRDGGGARADPPDRPAFDDEVDVRADDVTLAGRLTVPPGAVGVVVFAHGSGSSRHSPRNRRVADVLHRAGLGTLLFDLLTPDEEIDRGNVFDIELLAGRLLGATAWLRRQPAATGRPIGLFGASTGAAAALWAAAESTEEIAAVVSRGGRPDLAGTRLRLVRAPTLLIVGGKDHVVVDLNRSAQARLRCTNRLAIVPGATHLFEEHGALAKAATLATEWFTRYLAPQPVTPGAADRQPVDA